MRSALIIVDMVDPYDHEDADRLTDSVGHVILAGQVTEQCILYSALDAYVRHLEVSIPRDGVAHINEELAEAALKMMERNMRAEAASAADCRLEELWSGW